MHSRLTHSYGRFLTAAAVISAALLPAAVRAEVYFYAVTRHLTYPQTSNAQPATPEFWSLTAVLYADVPNEVLSGTLTFGAPPPVTYPLIISHPNISQYLSPYYADSAEFISAFPVTTYTVTVDRGGGPESGDVFLPEDLYCAEIPYLTGDTYDRLQSYDPSLAFDGTINGFTLAPGTNAGTSSVVVVEDGVPGAAWSDDLLPGDTAFQIPAGQLLPSRDYSISIGYSNGVQVPDAGFGIATSEAQFQRSASANFTTLSGDLDTDGDGIVNPNDVCCNTPPGVEVDAEGRPIGDLDRDCDNDLADFALYSRGFTGPLTDPTNCP